MYVYIYTFFLNFATFLCRRQFSVHIAIHNVCATTLWSRVSFFLRFCGIYPVNHMDTQEGVPGVLYGRYEKDRYGHMSQGNPWVTWLY